MKKARNVAGDLSPEAERDHGGTAAEGPGGGGASTDETGGAPLEGGLDGALAQIQGEMEALNDRHLRLAAEFSNYRRRAETEMSEAWGRAQADLLRRFLDVLDDLQRVSALDPTSESVTVQAVVEGIDLVERKFARVLEEAKVDVVEPAAGDAFDPGSMEAVMRVPADRPDEDDTVHQVFQKGYRFRSHLVRPARVSVRKHE